MKQAVKKLLSTLFFPFRFWFRHRLVVLAYHDIADSVLFEGQLKIVSKYYSPISIETLEKYLNKEVALPKYPILLTFDDGDVSMRGVGLKLLTKYRIPAVLFVISENIRNQQKFWWKTVVEYRQLLGASYQQGRMEVSRLKTRPNCEREVVLRDISQKAPELLKDRSLSVADLRLMQRSSVCIGSHTATHPILSQCSDEEVERELRLSSEFFRQMEIPSFRYFAYPNGDYKPKFRPLLREFGIALAFAFDHRINGKKIDPYKISRVRVNSDDSLVEFKLRISGISSLFN